VLLNWTGPRVAEAASGRARSAPLPSDANVLRLNAAQRGASGSVVAEKLDGFELSTVPPDEADARA